ncbi:hypothetical protein EJ02DRAFT_456454 [Clathrospora elynae]|uniref:Uncharacterized protein n=1 Tax=Clathrospora elynae TaxID=706981 RepID=A0A6A5SJP7_9PLEO|nr:hypothetical protein EJ02DRAFT_456454 [Clathrospora elynae]
MASRLIRRPRLLKSVNKLRCRWSLLLRNRERSAQLLIDCRHPSRPFFTYCSPSCSGAESAFYPPFLVRHLIDSRAVIPDPCPSFAPKARACIEAASESPLPSLHQRHNPTTWPTLLSPASTFAMQARFTTTEEHRSKRKFQPSITSYFGVQDDFEDSDDLRGLDPTSQPLHQHNKTTQQPRARLAPEVPGQVQADLLSVGMRVRKSVPEGYKTLKMSAVPSIKATLSKPRLAGLDVKPSRDAVPDDFVHQRELLPFCGLHKIGGFAEQPTTNIHLYAGLDSHGVRPTNLFPLSAEAFTQPFSSQSSTDSGYLTSSPPRRPNPLNPSKRSWQDEDDLKPLNTNFLFALPMKGFGFGGASVEMDDVPVSPLSETPPQSFNITPAVRQFAQPKSRRAGQRKMMGDEDMDMDMEMNIENAERIEGRIAAGSGSDFEEADFLAREVDMGDI